MKFKFTARDVKALCEETGNGMYSCKEYLEKQEILGELDRLRTECRDKCSQPLSQILRSLIDIVEYQLK